MPELKPYEPSDLMIRSRTKPIFLKDGGVVFRECEMTKASYEKLRAHEEARDQRRRDRKFASQTGE